MTTTREKFESKIIELGESLYQSHCHLKIHEWMTHESNKRLNEYPPFFHWSRMAHFEIGVLKLTRAYDQDGDSLGLLKILNILESDYRHWGCSETLNPQIIKQDKESVTEKNNNLVKKLKHLRDKTIAHTDHRQFPSRISDDIAKVYKEYGDELIWQQGRLTTEEIEKQPPAKRDANLHQMSEEIFQVFDNHENRVLGQEIPIFSDFYQLTTKGIEICNRYMQKLSIPLIELKLEGIDC
ncbi:hypothetical protein IQ244_08000 [Nostoc sp. LEGE 06077]|uniref:AbiU2 domain-containing protein n=1 Tax=Nostoc sp. LEGE 06077 TaxID=915325 RepID=UPI00188294C7|nr:hypothetical protein [Nostoc sp. LEGE 06077]MBE9206458.1 hypothetical protein [Nostoc sp. LEGE 06077]